MLLNSPWSSFQDYAGARKPHEWLNRGFILGYFGKTVHGAEKKYKKYVSGLEGKEYESPLKKVFASTILGDTDFIDYVKESFVKNRKTDKEIPAAKAFMKQASMEDIFKSVDREFLEERLSKDVKQYLCHRYTSERLKTIGKQFSVSESAVSHAVRRIATIIETDKKVRKKVDKLVNKLKLSRFKTHQDFTTVCL
jgi:putative transposase